jgi:hypothetical protein
MKGSNRSMICAIRGPITLITVGVLFALNNFTPYGFDKTWPVILIVFGLLSLIRRGMEPAPPQAPYFYPSGPGATAPPPPGGVPPGPGAPAGTSKGGFGTSAPPRASDAGGVPPPPGGPL